ncbi:MAG: fructosamine kinase family protein, partial [Pseudomonadales bacterium]|nr:fructosamine kinase family protein [Pseudomonadales bacterium]
GLGDIGARESLSGGCISEVSRLQLSAGSTAILKQHPLPPSNMFAAEAAGLNALRDRQALRVPQVLFCSEHCILLEDLGQGNKPSDFWNRLGTGLAALHAQTDTEFGFSLDNYCGATPQSNTRTKDGYQFFAEQRLLALGTQARNRGALSNREFSQLETLANNLQRWIPPLPPALIHGDLWSGNVHCTKEGDPALIDPATHWGWAEAELAMTDLFGGFPPAFYASYSEVSNLDREWRERVPLYNLYHLLNHLLLFGGSYHQSVRVILDRFAA